MAKKEGFFDKLTGNVSSLFLPPKEEKKEEKKPDLGDPLCRYEFKLEKPQSGVEENYFWFLTFIRNMNMNVEKISDVYTATETSSYFGSVEQKKATQEDRAAQFLGTIGNMIKSLFQILRELRIIDERLQYYVDSKRNDETGESAEIALKGMWIDVVEGGAKNPASVYGLSSQVGFVTLPDLFFKISSKSREDIGKVIQKLEMNRKIKEVLQRKLYQYYDWKEKTEKELATRKIFMLRYLKQHHSVIKMYMRWVKPYLRNIRKLQMEQKENVPDLVTAFETSNIELEIIATKSDFNVETDTGTISKNFKNIIPLIRLKFNFISIPQMVYQQEYQRGAIHAGRTTIVIEAFNPKMKEYEKYKEQKENEDIKLLSAVNESMESLSEELNKYLKEAEGKEEEKKEEKREPLLGFFGDAFKGFNEIFGNLIPKKPKKEKEKKYSYWEMEEEKTIAKEIAGTTYTIYDIFKKAHGMLSW